MGKHSRGNKDLPELLDQVADLTGLLRESLDRRSKPQTPGGLRAPRSAPPAPLALGVLDALDRASQTRSGVITAVALELGTTEKDTEANLKGYLGSLDPNSLIFTTTYKRLSRLLVHLDEVADQRGRPHRLGSCPEDPTRYALRTLDLPTGPKKVFIKKCLTRDRRKSWETGTNVYRRSFLLVDKGSLLGDRRSETVWIICEGCGRTWTESEWELLSKKLGITAEPSEPVLLTSSEVLERIGLSEEDLTTLGLPWRVNDLGQMVWDYQEVLRARNFQNQQALVRAILA